MFSAIIYYHVCLIDADHSYYYGYCLGGFWGADYLYGLFSTEIAPLRIFIEIGSRHYHFVHPNDYNVQNFNIILVGNRHDGYYLYWQDGYGPTTGIFFDQLFGEYEINLVGSHALILHYNYHFPDGGVNIVFIGGSFFEIQHSGGIFESDPDRYSANSRDHCSLR